MLCRLTGRDPYPKLKLYNVNSLLREHTKVTEVVNHTTGIYTDIYNSGLGHGSLPTKAL